MPPARFGLKLNSNCTYLPEEGKAVVAVLVQNSQGCLLDGILKVVEMQYVLMMEGIALLESIRLAARNELVDITFEADNQITINGVNHHQSPIEWSSEVILEYLQESKKLVRNHSCVWVFREANQTANWAGCGLACLHLRLQKRRGGKGSGFSQAYSDPDPRQEQYGLDKLLIPDRNHVKHVHHLSASPKCSWFFGTIDHHEVEAEGVIGKRIEE